MYESQCYDNFNKMKRYLFTEGKAIKSFLGPIEEDQSRLEDEDDSKPPVVCKVTTLEKVLSSLCSRHRRLLYHILMDMQEDHNASVALRDAHRWRFKAESLCCLANKQLPNDAPTLALSDCSVAAGICCRAACRLSTCAFPPVCVCLKNIHGHSCQNIAMACVGKVICSNSTLCCAHSKLLSCQDGDHTYISHAKDIPITPQNNCNSHNGCKGSRSPSPPPLSPKPEDAEGKMAVKNSASHIQDCKALNVAPPPLLPHKTETEDTALQLNNPPLRVESPGKHCERVVTSHTQPEKESDHQCGSIIGDLMDRVTEKLKSIQPSEGEQPPLTHASHISKTTDDTHLTEIITTVLHNSSDKDYNLNELLQQHVATEQRSPQTRFRRRQETLKAMSKSPDLPSSRRQSLQIKRDLARLGAGGRSYCRRKVGFEKKCSKNAKRSRFTSSLVEQSESRRLDRESKTVNTEPLKDLLDNPTTHAPNDERESSNQESQAQQHDLKELLPPDERVQLLTTGYHRKAKAKTHKEKSLTAGRSRRNIVPPQRFSSYVTEPRKMYFTACFSESIFVKHFSEDSTSTDPSDEQKAENEKQDCDKPQNIASPKYISLKKEPLCEDENDGGNPLKRSPRKRKTCQNSTSPSKRSKPHRTNSPDTDSHSPAKPMSNSTNTESVKHAEEFQSGPHYESPIKLMFVSSVTGEDGVKYTLKAASSGSNLHGDAMFDPCVESSWAGSAVDEHVQGSVTEPVEFGGNKCATQKEAISPDEVLLPNCSNSEGENQETIPLAHQTTPVKRRPGRPKKLGPHIEKSVKRPIGRPPKPKTIDTSASAGKTGSSAVNHRTTEMSCEDNANKNLKITVLYGRSRKTRRVVSEDLGNFPEHQHACKVFNSGTYSKTSSGKTSNDQMTKDQLKDLNFVVPVEDRKCTIYSSSNIKCQRQTDMAVSRKPGRPPKVKISGISVTVTTESPRQRKIHMKRDTKDSHLLRRTLLVELEPSKEQRTIEVPSEIPKDALKEQCKNPRETLMPRRHSVRERKPSIHLLHSVATAKSYALVRRSRKLLLNKASHPAQSKREEPPNNALSMKTKNVSCMQDVVRFSAVSVDSIFTSSEGFRWWPTSASPETLNEELARRIRLMSNTWVSDVLEANRSAETKTNLKPKPCEKLNGSAKKSASAIKMLFERSYDMEKLCTWFMQTTETQSLAIENKASARNPKDFFHYNPSRPNCKVNVCPSPQAERFRKHVKKFAKVVPKSPTMHKQAQEMLSKVRKTRRKLFHTSQFKMSHSVGQQVSRSKGTWAAYRAALLRARLKFRTRPRRTLRAHEAYGAFHGRMRTVTPGALTIELLKEMDFIDYAPTSVTNVQNALKLSVKNQFMAKSPQRMVGITDISKENRMSSKAWSPESLKECRVFLKKINSPNTKAATEECNICTVKLYDDSPEQEVNERGDCVMVGRTLEPVVQPPSSPKKQSKRGRKRGKRKSCSPPPPAKTLRQSRSSRGVLGARWCDFVLGSLK